MTGKYLTGSEQAMLTMALAVLCIPLSDALVKSLSDQLAAVQIAWLRFVMQTLVIGALVVSQRQAVGRWQWWYLLLGLQLAGAIVFLYWGLRYLPLANSIVIFFAEPLLLLVLARVFLGEQVSWRRWMVVGVGLSGVVIVLRPNWSLYGAAVLLPLLAALCYAGFMATARACQRDSALPSSALHLWVSAVATLALGLVLLVGDQQGIEMAQWRWPSQEQWLTLLAIGLLASSVHLMIAWAIARADASLLAPFQYLEIFGATLLGWWFFAEVPDALTMLGGAVIVGSGIWLFWHERQHAREYAAMRD